MKFVKEGTVHFCFEDVFLSQLGSEIIPSQSFAGGGDEGPGVIPTIFLHRNVLFSCRDDTVWKNTLFRMANTASKYLSWIRRSISKCDRCMAHFSCQHVGENFKFLKLRFFRAFVVMRWDGMAITNGMVTGWDGMGWDG